MNVSFYKQAQRQTDRKASENLRAVFSCSMQLLIFSVMDMDLSEIWDPSFSLLHPHSPFLLPSDEETQ